MERLRLCKPLYLVRNVAAMAIHELGKPPKETQKVAEASIQFYSTPPANVVELPERPPEPPDIVA